MTARRHHVFEWQRGDYYSSGSHFSSSGTDVVNIVDNARPWIFGGGILEYLAIAEDMCRPRPVLCSMLLRKMNIPTVIFINKIDQAGVDLQSGSVCSG